MRLFRIEANGLLLFKDNSCIDFYAEQRVNEVDEGSVYNVFNNIYTNNVCSIIGINASGKTSLLKMISFVVDMINGNPINLISNRNILYGSEKADFNCYFCHDDMFYKLHTEINNKELDGEIHYYIEKEEIYRKKTTSIKSKMNLFVFDNKDILINRDNNEEFLKDDISIAISLSRNNAIKVYNMINDTNYNRLKFIGNFPHDMIAFFDPNIERLTWDNTAQEMILKFHNREEIRIKNLNNLDNYLSSGTIKGLNIFIYAFQALISGGYMIVDELENHFNKEIVSTLLRFFTDKDINKNGATLIFSTHYSELLDEITRNDSINIVRNNDGITIQKLSHVLIRKDIKRSEIYKSDYLHGTAPSYDLYKKLKKSFSNGVNSI